jgi:dTDP-4-dehydrorhamnose reductase
MRRFRVLVTGATGFLAPVVASELRRRGHAVSTTSRSAGDRPADLTDGNARYELLQWTRPELVLHAAARASMAACARDPEGSRVLNALVPEALAKELGRRLVLVSTDLVFDGRSPPYAAGDPVAPLSVYGSTKAEGEERVLAAGGRVARLPLLFGPDSRHRGATGMVRAAVAEARPLLLYTNEYRTPLHVADAARGLADLLVLEAGPTVVHLPGPERISRWAFGRRFCAAHGLPADLLQPAECQDAARPRDVSLTGEWHPGRSLDAMLADS